MTKREKPSKSTWSVQTRNDDDEWEDETHDFQTMNAATNSATKSARESKSGTYHVIEHTTVAIYKRSRNVDLFDD